ncbi:NAV3, partial [Cervus elaphus hippelaphus]
MDVEGSRVWFMDLWNYSLVPYILEAVREGLQEGPALLQLRPEDVGYEGCVSTKEATTSKHIPQTDTEGDPLMNMLMKLQEAANYPGTQSCDSDSTSHHEDILDSSLESTL